MGGVRGCTDLIVIRTEIVPRVSETDGAGHINNVFIPIWFEAGRREVFRILNPDLGFNDWHGILVSIKVDYVEQIYYQHAVEVHTWIERLGNKSFTVGEEVWQNDRCCARGQAVYVYFDMKTQKSTAIPDDVRGLLEKVTPG